MNEHTKGPWKVEEIGGDSGAFRVGANGALLVATEANINLITAAPELLVANKLLREALHEVAHGQHSGRAYANRVLAETSLPNQGE